MTKIPPLNLAATSDPRIEGERVYLRRLGEEDLSQEYLKWMNAPEITRYLESRFIEHTFETLSAFVAAMARDPLNLFLGMFLQGDNRHIGNIKLGSIDVRHSRGEIGLIVGDKGCWGKGFASEAIGILSDFAFSEINLHKLVAGAYEDNQASVRAFEKVGYHREAILHSHWWSEGKFVDGIILAKINPVNLDFVTQSRGAG